MAANRVRRESMGLDAAVAVEVDVDDAADERCSRVEGVEDAAVVAVLAARGGDDAV